MQAPESYLATTLTSNWEDTLVQDAYGRIFLDFDPYCFQQIVAYLRQRAIDTEPVPYPAVQPNKQHMFNKLVQYLCLEEYMRKPQEPHESRRMKFTASHPEIALQLEGYHAVSTAVQPGYRCAVIGNLMPPNTNLILECEVTCADWLFIGIVFDCDDMSTAPNSLFATSFLHHLRGSEQTHEQDPFLGPVFPAAAVMGGVQHQEHWERGDIFGQHVIGWSSAKEEIRGLQHFSTFRRCRHLPDWNSGDRVWLEVDPVNRYVYMRHLSKTSTEHACDVKRVAGVPFPDGWNEMSRYSVQVVLKSSGDAVNLMPPPHLPSCCEDVDWVRL